MLITTAEPAFLAPGFDSGCALPGLDSTFVAVESVLVLGVAGLEPVFGVAGLELVGPRVGSDCVPAPAVPLLGSELVTGETLSKSNKSGTMH
jgi:hypothetical protein